MISISCAAISVNLGLEYKKDLWTDCSHANLIHTSLFDLQISVREKRLELSCLTAPVLSRMCLPFPPLAPNSAGTAQDFHPPCLCVNSQVSSFFLSPRSISSSFNCILSFSAIWSSSFFRRSSPSSKRLR